MCKPFIRLIKDTSKPAEYVSAFSAFNLKKVSSLSTHELALYGDSSIKTLIGQFGRDLPAKSLEGTEFEKADLSTEWKTYLQLLIKQLK